MNLVVLQGHLTKDVEQFRTNSNNVVSKFTIAVNNTINENVLYMDCELWNKEKVVKYLNKGSFINIQGYLKQIKWLDSNGVNKTKVITVVDKLNFVNCGGKKNKEKTTNNTEDEIPFYE